MPKRVIVEACHSKPQPAGQLESDLDTLLELQRLMRMRGYDEADIERTIDLIAQGGKRAVRQPEKINETVNTQEAAEILNVHTSTVEKLINQGALAAGKVGRRWVMMRQDVVAFAARTIYWQTAERLSVATPAQPALPARRRKGRFTTRIR